MITVECDLSSLIDLGCDAAKSMFYATFQRHQAFLDGR